MWPLLLGRTAITGGDYRSSQQHTFLLDSHYVEHHQQLIVYLDIILRLAVDFPISYLVDLVDGVDNVSNAFILTYTLNIVSCLYIRE